MCYIAAVPWSTPMGCHVVGLSSINPGQTRFDHPGRSGRSGLWPRLGTGVNPPREAVIQRTS